MNRCVAADDVLAARILRVANGSKSLGAVLWQKRRVDSRRCSASYLFRRPGGGGECFRDVWIVLFQTHDRWGDSTRVRRLSNLAQRWRRARRGHIHNLCRGQDAWRQRSGHPEDDAAREASGFHGYRCALRRSRWWRRWIWVRTPSR